MFSTKISQLKCEVTKKKLWNYGICKDILKEQHPGGLLHEKLAFQGNCLWDISPVMLRWLHTNPSTFDSVHNIRNRVKFTVSFFPDCFVLQQQAASSFYTFNCLYFIYAHTEFTVWKITRRWKSTRTFINFQIFSPTAKKIIWKRNYSL